MRLIIIGAVAAGTSAAAKARRNSEDAQITVYEKDSFISYSGCGMPYYIGGLVESAEQLTPRDPAFFKSKYNVDIFTSHEVLSIDRDNRSVEVRNLVTGDVFRDTYDRLILATGARAVVPPLKGAGGDHDGEEPQAAGPDRGHGGGRQHDRRGHPDGDVAGTERHQPATAAAAAGRPPKRRSRLRNCSTTSARAAGP